MAIDIHVEDCNFHDNSSVIRNLYDQKTVNQLTMEIEQAEERTDDKSILEALDKLKTAIEINNKPRISKVISDFCTSVFFEHVREYCWRCFTDFY